MNMPRTALVTGAARRIGRAIALSLASDGWAVAVHHHASEAEADETVAAITDAGGRAMALGGSLAVESEASGIIAEARAALGPIGCLINNAACFEYDHITEAPRHIWDRHMEVNLRAPVVLTQDFAVQLPEDARGAVINILDQRVWNLTPHFMSYTLSKAGLWALTQSAALALAPRIRVNAIGPGPVLASARQAPEQFAAQCAGTPLERGSTPDEICDAVRFILAAPAMTGQMIALDGGQHLGWTTPLHTAPEE